MESYYGEISALLTALFWTVTAVAFESAGKRVGSLSVNLIRLVIGFLFLGVYSYISRGYFLPVDAGYYEWKWLFLSGLVGFVIGDLCLFSAYVRIGARVSMLIMSLAPPIAALIGYIFLDEVMTVMQILAMIVIILGISLVILKRDRGVERKIRFTYPAIGLLLAFIGAVGQALGLVLSKHGMNGYDAFSATQIRVIAGIAGFSVMFFFIGRWGNVFNAVKNIPALKRITIGAIFGPFLGVSFSLIAVKYTTTGVASSLMAIVPVLIILPSVHLFKERVTIVEIIGAVITVIGVVMFFI
ncbi:MAG: DMT family transporter [Bacteroidales bacterium]|jgi:drug/metabolite transporter (DMT)-like permease|nr:DMT family transporter [Bacteroidales bacterium]